MNRLYSTGPEHQKGAATLLVTVVLLVLATMIGIYITKIGLLETKTSANANRAKEALHHAQAGLDFGAMNIQVNGASWADGTVYSVPLDNGASVSVRGFDNSDVLTVQAIGESIDGSGRANVAEDYGRFPLTAFGELPPLMSNGNFPPQGTYSIIGNPNGGGTGVPISAWVETGTANGNASWQTCQFDEFYNQGINAGKPQTVYDEDGDGIPEFIRCDACSCAQADTVLCDAKGVGDAQECDDIVADANIPDVYENLFGQPGEDWEEFMTAYATQMTCTEVNNAGTSLGDPFYDANGNSTSLPLIWIENGGTQCNLGSVGSYEKPVILFVHGDLKINAGEVIFGVVIAFSDIYNLSETYDISMNGGPTVYGVVLINRPVDLGNGNFSLVYNQRILERIANTDDGGHFVLGRRPGSWNDFN